LPHQGHMRSKGIITSVYRRVIPRGRQHHLSLKSITAFVPSDQLVGNYWQKLEPHFI
jgi:hypothetical protein